MKRVRPSVHHTDGCGSRRHRALWNAMLDRNFRTVTTANSCGSTTRGFPMTERSRAMPTVAIKHGRTIPTIRMDASLGASRTTTTARIGFSDGSNRVFDGQSQRHRSSPSHADGEAASLLRCVRCRCDRGKTLLLQKITAVAEFLHVIADMLSPCRNAVVTVNAGWANYIVRWTRRSDYYLRRCCPVHRVPRGWRLADSGGRFFAGVHSEPNVTRTG